MNLNAETSAHLSTVERSSRRTTPARPPGRLPAGWPDQAG